MRANENVKEMKMTARGVRRHSVSNHQAMKIPFIIIALLLHTIIIVMIVSCAICNSLLILFMTAVPKILERSVVSTLSSF
jgi:hypothetical protein